MARPRGVVRGVPGVKLRRPGETSRSAACRPDRAGLRRADPGWPVGNARRLQFHRNEALARRRGSEGLRSCRSRQSLPSTRELAQDLRVSRTHALVRPDLKGKLRRRGCSGPHPRGRCSNSGFQCRPVPAIRFQQYGRSKLHARNRQIGNRIRQDHRDQQLSARADRQLRTRPLGSKPFRQPLCGRQCQWRRASAATHWCYLRSRPWPTATSRFSPRRTG